MKSLALRYIGALALAVLGLSGAAQAGEPALLGTWTCDYVVGTPQGNHPARLVLVIDRQDGANFSGTKTWTRLDGSKGESKGAAVSHASEKVLGVIDYDKTGIHIVEASETGRYVGRLVKANTLQLVFTDAGPEARVARLTLIREPKKVSSDR